MKSSKKELLILILVILLGFFLRFYNLSSIPPGIHGDEAEFGIRQQQIIAEKNTNFFTLYDPYSLFNYSILSYWMQGIFQEFFGKNVFGIRFSSALAGSLSIVAFLFLTKQFFSNKLTQLLLTLAFTTSHWHIAYSRMAINNSWTPLFTICALGMLYKGFQTEKKRFYLLAGLIGGLSLYFAQANRVILVVFILWGIVHLLRREKRRVIIIKGLLTSLAAAFFVFLPLGLFYLNNPGAFSSRIETVSIFNNLPEYYTRYQVENVFGILFWQFINTLKVFNFGGDIGFYFYGYQGGLLAPIAGILAVAGLLICLLQIKKESNLLLLIWFFAIIILGGTITIDAPSSQRILGVIPVLFLFTGLACEKILKLRLPYLKTILVILFLLNSLWDYKIYFINYLNTQAGWAQREPATQISYYLQSLGPNWKVYMLKEEFWYTFNHGPIKFLNPGLEGEDVTDSKSVIPNTQPTTKNIVYIMPPNSPSLDRLRHFYPKGKIRKFFNPIGNTPSFASFEVQSNMLE